jgi:hypothetical protein
LPTPASPREDSHRLFLCAACRRQVRVCRRCDRGQIYCAEECRLPRRRQSVRLAGRRYQRTAPGARSNARRQKRFRSRCALTVTHQGSPEAIPRAEEAPAVAIECASATVFPKPQEESHRATLTSAPLVVVARVPPPPRSPRCDFCGLSCGVLSRRGPVSRVHRARVLRRVRRE